METEEKKSLGRKIKFGVIVSSLVVIGLVSGYVLGVYGYVKIIGPYLAEIKYKKWLDDYLKPYKEDFIGGNTPEETIDLFIAALKKGDYGLASRYFVVERQEEWKETLTNMKNAGKGQGLISELETAKKIWHKKTFSDKSVEFWYDIIEGEPSRDINLTKNVNNKWKIESL